MSAVNINRVSAPQAFTSSYAPRIRTYGNSLLTPVQPQNALPNIRTTKRGTTAINYAEEFDDDSIDDSDAPRRSMGLRTNQQRREVNHNGEAAVQKELGREVFAPMDVQGIWREWMGKPKRTLTEKQMHVQSALPTTLVPIRIDLDIVPFRPEAALPTPNNAKDFGIDENLPAYKAPEPTSQFRLKDSFLWNLHEAIITPDQFAKTFVDELDFPVSRKIQMIAEIAQQIRQQLEEHAPTALHPLFQPTTASEPAPPTNATTPSQQHPLSREDSSSSAQFNIPSASLLQPPKTNGHQVGSGAATPLPNATATPALAVTAQPSPSQRSMSSMLNPPDSHRCVLHISINLQNRLYTDKFEWSLLYPPGFAEMFAKQTCADMGLSGEWVPNMTLAIYEASLRLKKDMIENGGSLAGVVGSDVDNWGVVDNEACEFHGTAESALGVGAGWRFDEDALGYDWEPKIEELSKEEIEKREGDRERQLRRARRDTARFTNAYSLQAQNSGVGDYFAGGLGTPQAAAGDDERMGRGERAKKKRRFRSLSPVGRETPEVAGFGGTSQQLTEGERQYWHCSHCKVWGQAIWGVRDGPAGSKPLDALQQLWPALRTGPTASAVESQPVPAREEPKLARGGRAAQHLQRPRAAGAAPAPAERSRRVLRQHAAAEDPPRHQPVLPPVHGRVGGGRAGADLGVDAGGHRQLRGAGRGPGLDEDHGAAGAEAAAEHHQRPKVPGAAPGGGGPRRQRRELPGGQRGGELPESRVWAATVLAAGVAARGRHDVVKPLQGERARAMEESRLGGRSWVTKVYNITVSFLMRRGEVGGSLTRRTSCGLPPWGWGVRESRRPAVTHGQESDVLSLARRAMHSPSGTRQRISCGQPSVQYMRCVKSDLAKMLADKPVADGSGRALAAVTVQ
nr:chromatin structure-remodeling complex subunit sfh1 [Quercus suber]